MTEILLKCPKCGTEYHLPATAIPPEGREVECTACNNSWLALAGKRSEPGMDELPGTDEPIPLEPGSEVVRHEPSHSRAVQDKAPATEDTPPLRRRVPENVLKILQEEVEYERRARMGENAPKKSVVQDDPSEFWPATTITEPADPARRQASKEARRTIEPPKAATPLASTPYQEAFDEKPARDMPAAPDPLTHKARSGYFAGFGLALTAAAVALVMYLIPTEQTGIFAENLSQYQRHVDEGRNWLQDRVLSLTEAK